MRRTALIAATLICALRASAADAGLIPWQEFTPHGEFIGETVGNVAGGLARGSTATAYFQGGFDWIGAANGADPGGKLVVRYLGVDTGQPDALYVGDVQGVSNLTTPTNINRLFKLYFRQRLGAVTTRFGLMDANDYFDSVQADRYLLCASYGIFPVWSTNLPGTSTYPYSSLGAIVSVGGSRHQLEAGVFGGNALHPFLHPTQSGTLALIQYNQSGSLGAGTYALKLGGFFNHQSPRAAALLGPQLNGFFGSGVYRFRAAGLDWGTFLIGGGAPNAVASVPWYVGGGVRLKKWYPGQPGDVLSVGFSRASLSGQPHAETDYEATAIFKVCAGVEIQPDIQVIAHPGGHLPTAVAGILRIRVDVVRLFAQR